MDVVGHMYLSMAISAVLVALAIVPARLLVVIYSRNRRRTLWVAAAMLSGVFAYWSGLHDSLSRGDLQMALFKGWTTVPAPFAATACLVRGLGGTSVWRQTLGTASVGILTAALPFMIMSGVSGTWQGRLMAAAAAVLTCYAIGRHVWQRRIGSRRTLPEAAA